MRKWWSASDLADAQLPGLPTSARRIRSKATADGWQSRQQAESTGGRRGQEYRYTSLPPEAQVQLLAAQKEALRAEALATAEETDAEEAATKPAEHSRELWAHFEGKPEGVREEANRRLDAVLLVEKLIEEGMGKMQAYQTVADQTGQGEPTIRLWIRTVQGVSRHDYLPKLAPRWTGRTATVEVAPQIYQLYRDLYLAPEPRGHARCYRDVKEVADAHGWEMPSPRTMMRRFKAREDPRVVVLEREGPRAAAEMFPYQERDRSGFYAMEALNMDGHLLDVSVVWPDGEVCRINMITIQDLYSGMIVGHRLAKSESAYEVQLAFLGVTEKWGLPAHLYVDNTLAMASKRMTAGMPFRRRFKDQPGDEDGILKQLGVKLHWTTPAHGQAKPIERAFRDLAEAISKNPLLSGAYLGNNPQSKPHNYGARTVTVAEVEEIAAAEIYRHNHQPNRNTGVCRKVLSFDQAFQPSYESHRGEIAVLTPMQRRILYLDSNPVTGHRKSGAVKVHGNRYWHPSMAAFRGRKMIVRFNPDDLQGTVYVYRLNGDLITEAECVEKKGFADKAAAEEHGRNKRQYTRQAKKMADTARQFSPAEVMRMRPPVPLEVPAAEAPRDVTRIQPAAPSVVDRIAVVPEPVDAEENQRKLMKGLDSLSDALRAKIEEGRRAG